MMPSSPSCEFQDQLTAFLPKMRVWSMALTRNRAAADDLVQDVAMKALAASESFVAGTNFSAWVHRIMLNHFISGVRSRREYSDLDQMPEVGIPATQHDRTELRELNVAFQRLPRVQKEALRMIGIEEQSYEEAAGVTGCAVGTLKSRVHRARLNLRSLIYGEIKAAA
jgi:RNA polymerase sigma-70 factor (ECF subfamily)